MNRTGSNELSERELDILRLVATGASNKEIALNLSISPNTVKVHLRNIFEKIHVVSRTEAAIYAMNIGLGEKGINSFTKLSEPEIIENDATKIQMAQGISAEPRPNFILSRFWVFILLISIMIGLIVIIFTMLDKNANSLNTTSIVTSPPQTTSRWNILGNMPTKNSGFAAAVYDNKIYVIAGNNGKGVIGTVERYLPEANSWEELATKPIAVSDVQAVVIGGLIFVPGGMNSNGLPTKRLEIYDPTKDEWKQGPNLPQSISAYAAVAFEGKLIILGGWNGKEYLKNVYMLDPTQNEWMELPEMSFPKGFAGGVIVGNKIFVVGGFNGTQPLNTVDILTLPDRSGKGSFWTPGTELPEGRYDMGITNISDLIFMFGGKELSSQAATLLHYSSPAKTWQLMDEYGDMNLIGTRLVALGQNLYILGGNLNNSPVDKLLSYQAINITMFPIIR